MRLPRLEMHSQLGTVAIKTNNAVLKGGRGEARVVLRGHASSAAVRLQTTSPQIRMDNTRFRESVGIDTPLESWRKCAARGTQHFIERIGGIAREGVAALKIERGGGGGWEAIRRIAANKGYKDVQLTIKPAAPPDISAIMGTVNIQDASEKVRTDVLTDPNRTTYTRGKVSVQWRQKPRLDISVVPGTDALVPTVYGQGLHIDRAL